METQKIHKKDCDRKAQAVPSLSPLAQAVPGLSQSASVLRQ
ncbi:hypothetical protein [Scytonema sp. UIC 10036]|nr:hypothetical protein [Scytonema sp. UIC 10036]